MDMSNKIFLIQNWIKNVQEQAKRSELDAKTR
jgi:hypothetical protein